MEVRAIQDAVVSGEYRIAVSTDLAFMEQIRANFVPLAKGNTVSVLSIAVGVSVQYLPNVNFSSLGR